MFSCTFIIIQCYQDGADDFEWCLLGGSGEDPDNSCIIAYTSDHCGESTDGSGIVECKVQVKELHQL